MLAAAATAIFCEAKASARERVREVRGLPFVPSIAVAAAVAATQLLVRSLPRRLRRRRRRRSKKIDDEEASAT